MTFDASNWLPPAVVVVLALLSKPDASKVEGIGITDADAAVLISDAMPNRASSKVFMVSPGFLPVIVLDDATACLRTPPADRASVQPREQNPNVIYKKVAAKEKYGRKLIPDRD